MTKNDELVDYLGLEFELCYLNASGDAFWILADKVRRRDEIALEMLRIFNRFMRIGKSLDRVNERRPPIANCREENSPSRTARNNAPYAHCIGVRVRVHEHVAALHVRVGIDVRVIAGAPRLSSGALLDPNVQLQLDDPIVTLLTTAGETTNFLEPTVDRPKKTEPPPNRSRRPKSND